MIQGKIHTKKSIARKKNSLKNNLQLFQKGSKA